MGNYEEEMEGKGMDRRSFFKLGGLTAGAAALAGMVACSPQSEPLSDTRSAGGENETVAATANYSVFETDILIIGAGFGGSYAAAAARKAGKNVIMVDKGPYGFTGNFGMNFDFMHTWDPTSVNYASEADVPDGGFMRNKTLYNKAVMESETGETPDVSIANFGEVWSPRNEDGTIYYIHDYPTMRGLEHSMTRQWTDYFRTRDYLTIHDKTIITDLIIENGRCLGAMGVYLPTGEYHVFRAKATLVASGGTTQFYGWNSTSATSNHAADNTGDVEMSLLRHGGKIISSEFCTYDLMGIYPRSFAASEGTMVGADSVHSSDLMDKNGNYLKDDPELAELLATQEGVIQAACIVADRGDGSENGGIFLDCKPEAMETMRWMYQRNAAIVKEKFGYDFTSEPVEVVPEMYEHSGEMVVDDNAMCVDAEGLFGVRSNTGAEGGNNNTANRRMGRYAMKMALEYVDSYVEPESVTYETVAAEIARLEDLRTRQIDGSIRPITIRRSIQNACAKAARPSRPTEVLEEAKTELERILAEDMPKMACADDSLVYNTEWKEAIETTNLLDVARLFVNASLERQESRASLIRPEYPETDDENWYCALAYTRAEDGSLSYEKIPY